MVSIKIYDKSKIDTSSNFIKGKVTESIKQYIIENWDKCVQYTTYKTESDYRVDFKIEL